MISEESYGPDVDSLYYYLVNLKRLAVRLDELGLRDTVQDIRERVNRAVDELTDSDGTPIVEEPGYVTRLLQRSALKLAQRRG